MIFGFKEDKSKVDILNMFYPIGCYFYTSNGNFNPNTEWGGNWTLVEEGQVLLAGSADGTYEVGNEYGSNTHVLTVAEMPSHAHYDGTQSDSGISANSGSVSAVVTYAAREGRPTTSTGGGQAHSIMQASTAVYIWHRIA